MPRCGCVEDVCNCTIIGGRGVSLSGSGSQGNPLLLDVSTVAYFQREPGEGTEVAVTGSGTPTDPYVIEADLSYTGTIPQHSVYSTPGWNYTWTKPDGVTLILVTLIGGGQGGQGGGGISGGVAVGGIGGAGGGYTSRYIYIPTAITYAEIHVGAGGSGGSGAAIPYGLPQVIGNFGNNTRITFFTATDEVYSIYAGGGGTTTTHRGYAMQPGQQPPASFINTVPMVPTYAGGAGGGGESSTAGGGPRMGGTHDLYVGNNLFDGFAINPGFRPRGGNGGSGGGVIGGSGRNGENGYLHGGGGGGGASATVTNPYAGHGGNGAGGIAVISTF